jgi:hypothetical protein
MAVTTVKYSPHIPAAVWNTQGDRHITSGARVSVRFWVRTHVPSERSRTVKSGRNAALGTRPVRQYVSKTVVTLGFPLRLVRSGPRPETVVGVAWRGPTQTGYTGAPPHHNPLWKCN